MGFSAELRMPTHKWEGIWAIHSLTWLGRSLCNFLGVWCGICLVFRVKDVFSSLGSIWGSVPNYGCPPIRGRVPGLPIVLRGWGDPCANFLGSGAVFFWGLGVRCGRVKLVSSSLGSIWGVSAELRMLTYKGGTWATHSLTRLGRPLRKFLGVRCGSFLGYLGPVP